MPPPKRPSAESSEAGNLTARLTADHGEIDVLFHDAQTAMDRGLAADAYAALDEVWMRLAVHIRAEHKVVFPALVEARPALRAALQTLREDHDFFMTSLAEAVKILQAPSPGVASARVTMEAVRLRLASHNAIEEESIYPVMDQLPHEQRVRFFGDGSRELAFHPKRYRS